MGGIMRLYRRPRELEVHLRPGLGAEVIATGDAHWLNAPSSGAFLATLDLVDFALPNTATIPTSIDT